MAACGCSGGIEISVTNAASNGISPPTPAYPRLVGCGRDMRTRPGRRWSFCCGSFRCRRMVLAKPGSALAVLRRRSDDSFKKEQAEIEAWQRHHPVTAAAICSSARFRLEGRWRPGQERLRGGMARLWSNSGKSFLFLRKKWDHQWKAGTFGDEDSCGNVIGVAPIFAVSFENRSVSEILV